MLNPIRVGIVDDHEGMRGAIRKLLAHDEDIIIVGEGSDGEQAIQLADFERPDILVLDVELPKVRGDQVVQQLQQQAPEVKVLALSSYDDPDHVRGMLEHGAAGYMIKEEAPRTLLAAVHSIILDHVKWTSSQAVIRLSAITLDDKSFSGNQLQILRYIVLNQSDNDICEALHIDPPQLNNEITLLLGKFNVSSRNGLKDAARLILSTR